jgi:hypothetical protein
MGMQGRGKQRRRWSIAVALASAAAVAGSALAGSGPAGPPTTGFVVTRDCQEHQAFIQGDPGAVAAQLPGRYTPVRDPATRAPVLFVRALKCAALEADGRAAPATVASYGVVVNSPDGSGCASGAPAVGPTRGDEPPLCNWYALAWLASDARAVAWLRSGTPSFPVYKVPGLVFELGAFDAAKGGAPLHVSAPAPSPSPFKMDDVGRARPGALSVRGNYWNDTPQGTVRVRFSTEELTSGDADGTVRAPAGSGLAKLMGATQRPYLSGPFSAISAEHWDHASYRKQIERANAPGDGLDGSCSVQGTVTFDPPAVTADQDLTYDYIAGGTCTGTLNGHRLENAPVNLHQRGPAHGGCVTAHTIAPGEGSMVFSGGARIGYTVDFSFVGTDGDLTLYGTRAGSGSGHGSFVSARTDPTGALACGAGGVKQVPLDWSFTTRRPVIGAPARPPALRVSVRPRRVRAGRRTTFGFAVTDAAGAPLRGAAVRLAGRRGLTARNGRTALAATLRRPGRVPVLASELGFAPARTSIVVLPAARARNRHARPRKRAPRFTG